jgi:UDP-glucose:(heptosyl)LPS alpha-1,3-glucosyltransferase
LVYPSYNRFKFFPKPQERDSLRKRFNFPEKVVVALVTSGNFKKRGLDLFIEAIHQLPADVRDRASFRVVGKDEAKQYLDSKITFDPGLSDIENYYNAIDVMVLPARFEEFGRVVLESMGCGLPVITTDKVGVSELIQGESRQFVIPASTVEPLSEAMRKLIMDSELRKRLGALNQESAKAAGEDRLNDRFDEVFLS